MNILIPSCRRNFVTQGGAIIAAACALPGIARAKEKEEEEEVSPGEDLMQEHGVLKRVLLVYEEAIRRLQSGQDLPIDAVADGAKVIRTFVEDYHEKQEEDFLFPRFEKAGKQVELVRTLRVQHQAGRRLTDVTLSLCKGRAARDAESRRALADSLHQFIRMYSPHEAREDTVLFPAFRKLVSKHEYDALGEDFEKREHQHFGEDGFEMMVAKVTRIEKRLGIYDLSQFTPRLP